MEGRTRDGRPRGGREGHEGEGERKGERARERDRMSSAEGEKNMDEKKSGLFYPHSHKIGRAHV